MSGNLKLVNNASSIAEAALAIARERRELQLRLCDAVLHDRHDEARILAKELSGKHEAGNRTGKSFDRIPGGRR